ncbi:hypothetical protein ACQ4PT_023779 [Festuca glaucescens]
MAVDLEATTRRGGAGVWSTCGPQALRLAAANGRTVVCRYLVEHLAVPVDAPSSSGETPLLLAATSGHTATAAYLLERGADPRTPENDGETPLHWAAYNGDRELAMLLLSRGADVGAANPRGTALHVAAAQAHPAVVALLLNHGADAMKFDDDTDASLYSNRSICWLRLGMGDEALSDACACIRMRPDLAKGYFRQGMALCFLQVIITTVLVLLLVLA